MAANPVLLFLIVGKNEPLYEAEITKRGISGNTDTSVARQSYFVVHSSLDLVDRATWSSQNVCCVESKSNDDQRKCSIHCTCISQKKKIELNFRLRFMFFLSFFVLES